MLDGQLQRDPSAHGNSDEVSRLDVLGGEKLPQHLRLLLDGIGDVGLLGVAVAQQVEGVHVELVAQVHHRRHPVQRFGSQSVDEDQRRAFASLVVVHAIGANLRVVAVNAAAPQGEAARRRAAPPEAAARRTRRTRAPGNQASFQRRASRILCGIAQSAMRELLRSASMQCYWIVNCRAGDFNCVVAACVMLAR